MPVATMRSRRRWGFDDRDQHGRRRDRCGITAWNGTPAAGRM